MMDAQRTEAWFDARRGKVTASRVADVIAKTKTGYGASRANYAAELIAERLTGVSAERFTNAAMQWGTDTEPQARDAYSFLTDIDVTEVGFFIHPSIPESGASPDGQAGEGLVEIKCPNTATHIATLLDGKVPAKYVTQMQWQMACTGAEWCDFVSFDPRMPADLQIFIRRVPRDPAMIVDLETEVRGFLIEVQSTIIRLETLRAAA